MGSILKTIVIAAGAGVALGICTTAGNRRASKRVAAPRRVRVTGDEVLAIEPLLDRLETIERRYNASGPLQPHTVSAVPVEALAGRLDAQDAEIERLRRLIDSRAGEIQTSLEAEMEARHQLAFAKLEQTVEIKISDRIAAIEQKLAQQSVSIEQLRERAQETDANIKRLVVAIEKLVERTPVPQPVPGPPPTVAPPPFLVPFETHLSEARRKALDSEPEPPVETKKRFPLARIFGMIALVFALNTLPSFLN